MGFPNFSEIEDYVKQEFIDRKGNTNYISSLNPWIRISSGVHNGFTIVSNPDWNLFKAAGADNPSIYGSYDTSGTIGTDWAGTIISQTSGQGFRPKPNITSIEIDEGAGNLSRKASFTVTAYSLEQMDEITKYLLEPGYTIFIEWGWNTPNGVSGLAELTADDISKFQDSSNTQEKRKASAGHYDNYIGYITGGGLSLNGDKWDINVNCTGYTELPAYLLGNEVGDENKDAISIDFTSKEIDDVGNDISVAGKKRFMIMFNELSSSRKIITVKSLQDNISITQAFNYLNFEESVKSKVNDKTDGTWLGFFKNDATIGKDSVDFPKGTELVKDDRYIRFGTAIDILNALSFDGYKIGNNIVKTKINISNVPIKAFKHIFSTDYTKLFIPNANTPTFAIDSTDIVDNTINNDNNVTDCSIGTFNANIIKYDSNSSAESGQQITIQFPESTVYSGDNADLKKYLTTEYNWGYLEYLYINFEFFKNTISTANTPIKDILYNLLNGISSAVNGLWDFQIVETEKKKNDINYSMLSVVDLNLINKYTANSNNTELKLDLIGSNSIFIDASLSMNISGMMVNNIIGKRFPKGNNSKLNTDLAEYPNTLFASDGDGNPYQDMILKELSKPTDTDSQSQLVLGPDMQLSSIQPEPQPQPQPDPHSKKLTKAELIDLFVKKITLIPKYTWTGNNKPSGDDMYAITYIAAYDDTTTLSAFNKHYSLEENDISILLPIDFSFTVHGISGIRRGDKFRVNGIPKKYEENGFFQVTSVKHSIENMKWTTTVTGGLRMINK